MITMTEKTQREITRSLRDKAREILKSVEKISEDLKSMAKEFPIPEVPDDDRWKDYRPKRENDQMSGKSSDLLFCKQCRGIKADDREYCCYCVGMHEVNSSPVRVRVALRILPNPWRTWFVFCLGYGKRYKELIPEHLRNAEWLDIEEINKPPKMDDDKTGE